MKNGMRQIGIIICIMCGIIMGIATSVFACPYNKCLSMEVGELMSNALGLFGEIHGISVAVEENDVLMIRINSTSGGWDPVITLIHPSGYTILSDGTPGSGRAEILSPILDVSDSYDILVWAYGSSGTGGYNVSIEAMNRPVKAATINFDDYLRDSLVSASEIKSYRFEAEAGDFVSVEMIGITDDLRPHVRLFAPDGKLVAGDIDSDFALLSNVRLYQSGMYAIVATDYIGSAVGEYFLVLLKPSTGANGGSDGLPAGFALEQNRPNPFNPATDIAFTLPRSSFVTVDIYNVAGGLVRTLLSRDLSAGEHRVTWDGRDENGGEASSGIYFYRLSADGFSESKKMLLMR